MNVEDSTQLLDCFLDRASRHPGRPLLHLEAGRKTYGEVRDEASRLARALQSRGLIRGDRVLLLFENGFELVVSIYAALMAGGVLVLLHPQTPARKIRFVLEDAEARYFLSEVRLAGTWLPALEGASYPEEVVYFGSFGEPSDALDFLSETQLAAVEDPEPLDTRYEDEDLAALIYTSGSTGEPKGVMQSHGSMAFAVHSLSSYLGYRSGDRILDCLPLSFDYGLYQLFLTVQASAELILLRSFSFPGQILRALTDKRTTVFPAVPTLLRILEALDEKQPQGLVFPEVRLVSNTAAALTADLLPGLRKMFPEARIFSMYGLTECKRVSFLDPDRLEHKPLSVGQAIPGTEVFILDEQGHEVAPGEVGRLHVRGRHVMQGYWHRLEESEAILSKGMRPGERQLDTGDLFKRDEDGDLYFVSRSDDIIKTRGEKVSPLEVEHVLQGLAMIKEAAVLGHPDLLLGEAVHAYVVLEEGEPLDPDPILRALTGLLEPYMIPTQIHILDQLPRSPNGKVDKHQL
jgi:long-chain acyl-CoA synthetase